MFSLKNRAKPGFNFWPPIFGVWNLIAFLHSSECSKMDFRIRKSSCRPCGRDFARNSRSLEHPSMYIMPRKKLDNPEDILSQPIIVRVTEKVFKRLEKIQQESGCQSIGEVARMILSGEQINCFYKDVSLNAPMEEMALIRKELKAIGININQQTKFFHMSKSEAQRAFFVLKTAELYKKVDGKVEELLSIINRLAEKWLHVS
jgi:hypothetical protein